MTTVTKRYFISASCSLEKEVEQESCLENVSNKNINRNSVYFGDVETENYEGMDVVKVESTVIHPIDQTVNYKDEVQEVPSLEDTTNENKIDINFIVEDDEGMDSIKVESTQIHPLDQNVNYKEETKQERSFEDIADENGIEIYFEDDDDENDTFRVASTVPEQNSISASSSVEGVKEHCSKETANDNEIEVYFEGDDFEGDDFEGDDIEEIDSQNNRVNQSVNKEAATPGAYLIDAWSSADEIEGNLLSGDEAVNENGIEIYFDDNEDEISDEQINRTINCKGTKRNLIDTSSSAEVVKKKLCCEDTVSRNRIEVNLNDEEDVVEIIDEEIDLTSIELREVNQPTNCKRTGRYLIGASSSVERNRRKLRSQEDSANRNRVEVSFNDMEDESDVEEVEDEEIDSNREINPTSRVPLSDRILWKDVISTLQSGETTGSIVNLVHKSPRKFLKDCSPLISSRFQEELKRNARGLRLNLKLAADFSLKRKGKSELKYFNSSNVAILSSASISSHLAKLYEEILNEIHKFTKQNPNQNYVCSRFVMVCYHNYASPSALSYIPLPPHLPETKKGAIVNIRTDDEFSFIYSILAGMHNMYSTEVTSYKHFRMNEMFNLSGIVFPIRLSSIGKFEAQNPAISINVFGFRKNLGLRVRYSTERIKKYHFDLLYLESNVSYHYCLIKCLSLLCYQ